MPSDPRHRSGEHRAPDSETPEGMRSMTTIEALGIEIQAMRRENRLQFKHVNQRTDEIGYQIKDMLASMQGGLTHCATHDVQIAGIDKRVVKLETKDESDAKTIAAELRAADRGGPSTASMALGSPPDSQNVLMAFAKSKSWPWAICTLIALAMILAAITGRNTDSIVPNYHNMSHGSPSVTSPPSASPAPAPVTSPGP